MTDALVRFAVRAVVFCALLYGLLVVAAVALGLFFGLTGR